MNKPRILGVSAASGAGKTTLVGMLCEDCRFKQVVTATTRNPRQGEIHGVHYYFVSKLQFEKDVQVGQFLEYATVFGGNYYGTLWTPVKELLDKGIVPVLAIDVQGHALVRQHPIAGPLLRSVFIRLPVDELEKRLRARGDTDEEAIQRRLAEAPEEMKRMDEFDRIVVNDRPKQVVFDEFRAVVEELIVT